MSMEEKMLSWMVMASAVSFSMPSSVDPEIVHEVEVLLEKEGGWSLAADRIDELARERGVDAPVEPSLDRRRWLPVVTLRLTLGSHDEKRRRRWEFLVLMAWPLG